MPQYDFDGKVAFVTGAARGQGRSHAVTYAEHGADVVVADACNPETSSQYDLATEDDLAETARQVETHGSCALPVQVDVSDEASVEAAVETALDEFGQIDVLANNAGIWNVADLLELSEEQWHEVVDTDLKGVWLCSKHVGRHFADRGDGGRIVSTISTAGRVGTPGSGHYAAAKHGVVGLTKTLAIELAEYNVTVNAVGPTGVDTPMLDRIRETIGEEAMTRISDASGTMNIMDEQLIDPRDVSEAYMWLSSEAARYVTGTVLWVDAGMMSK